MRIWIAATPAALLTAVVMLLAFPPPVAAQNLTTADETYCYNKLMSGTVQWNAGGASKLEPGERHRFLPQHQPPAGGDRLLRAGGAQVR